MPNVAFSGAGGSFRPIREIDYRALRLLTQRSVGSSPLKLDLAVRRLDKAWRENRLGYPEDEPPEWKWRMCEARMMLGDYSEWRGWEYRSDWSAGLWHNPEGSWQGQPVDLLHVFGEQGVGDEVCFSQVLPDISKLAKKVVFETDPRLIPVFRRSLGVDAVSARFEDGVRKFRKPEGPWMPLGDLLRNFRRTLASFKREPYLTADPEQIKRFEKYKGRVGISWRGAQGSYQLEEFKKGLQEPLGLQYDIGWDEEVETPDLDLRNDLEGLFGLLVNLERVVTVSTSVAHFAGALGVKTDVILSPLNGIRKNLLPFKWYCEPMLPKSPWFPDTVTVYRNLEEYRRARL